ncbi:hypothetical protein Rhopal_007302-T1 [Rhodotorula paludigena]|uniref:Cation efflux protein cytoplasmic domain-containing protein n=1 Tax=Rhodotorula paludigena TaxID=86838 RepID=A0AAV5GVD3_9BASI|nr:hypothetical protein Rhopal_007302-T1 [Rhodotorula paludigena]
MSLPVASHPLETLSKASSDSLPTPPRSPAREHVPVIGAPAPLDHARLGDVEGAVTSPGLDVGGSYFPALTPTTSHDPLLLRDRLQTPETLSDLRRRKNKSHAFYTRQNSHIDSLLKHLDEHVREAEEEEDASRILAVLQLYAAISSLSLSIFGTAIDSVFDPAANLILWWCHRQSDRVDLMKYPSGGSKFESIGDIVYSGIMGAVSVILVAFSVQDLARRNTDKELHIPALIVVGIAFATKFALFAYCFSIRGKNSQVRVLWEDHRNDLFINGFGLFTSAAGAKIAWWILAGQAAPMDFQNLITYKAMTFAEQIEAIDSCVAYHNGPRYVVEVDLVMKGDTPLRVAHDVSQALQDKIEELPQVDRAFVHVDHETSHKPEHRKTK